MNLADAARLFESGRLDEAETACRRAISVDAGNPEAHHFLGLVLRQTGRLKEAEGALRYAVRLAPNHVYYRINLAAVLGQLDKSDEAVGQLASAMLIKGDIPELHNNLGAALEKLGRLREAASALENALAMKPDYLEAHRNRGNVLKKMERMAEAAEHYRAALALRPEDGESLAGLSSVLSEMADVEGTIDACTKIVALMPRNPAARSSLLYTLHYSPDYNLESLFHEHREWGRLFCDPLREERKPHDNERRPERKLRVGYVSPDLREHTVTKFVTSAMEHHDRERFALFCYSDAEKPDAVTGRLRRVVENWHETRKLNDAELEAFIRGHRIDILVDLRGHAAANRLTLFARKPAPVQVNMVGYFNTTGLATMDYRITDEHQDPPGMTEQFHTEQLVRLPHSCWCYTADVDGSTGLTAGAPEVTEPPALKNGYVTFGSLNKTVKVSEPCAKLWARVMESVPNSRLVLAVAEAGEDGGHRRPCGRAAEREDGSGGSAASPQGRTSGDAPVRDRLSRVGLPIDRVELLGKTLTRREYLQRFDRIDIALDTFPFNGITTTCDGLWQGVPCVSLAGGTSVSRAGRSILRAANLPELATDTPGSFVRTVVELATDLDRLRELRMSMRKRLLASPLMDHIGFARNLESAYRQMWRQWCGRA